MPELLAWLIGAGRRVRQSAQLRAASDALCPLEAAASALSTTRLDTQSSRGPSNLLALPPMIALRVSSLNSPCSSPARVSAVVDSGMNG